MASESESEEVSGPRFYLAHTADSYADATEVVWIFGCPPSFLGRTLGTDLQTPAWW